MGKWYKLYTGIYGAVFIEDILAAVRSCTTGRRVEFSDFSSKNSTIASVAGDPERCAITEW